MGFRLFMGIFLLLNSLCVISIELNKISTNIFLYDLLPQRRELEYLLGEITKYILVENNAKCLSFITDEVYLNLFRGEWFDNFINSTYTMVVVKNNEDLLSPNYETLKSIRQVKRDGCQAYILLISNGIQLSRFLKFGDRYRVLDTRAKYVMLHDFRILQEDMHYIWKRIVNVVFIRHYIGSHGKSKTKSWFELSTVPFPAPIYEVLVTRRLYTWHMGEKFRSFDLFPDKTSKLRRKPLKVVVFKHVPAIVKSDNSTIISTENTFSGMEIEIVKTFAKVMNFEPKIYEPLNANTEQWGRKLLNGSYSGLLGEMVSGKADIALGNLHYTPYHLQLTDLTIPYISECLTFLTPESETDNSWQTLILPFELNMWIAVLLLLMMSGFIFFFIAKYHKHINSIYDPENNQYPIMTNKILVDNRKNKNDSNTKTKLAMSGLYIFEELTNCILYTYGMLLVISLPKLPGAWSLRLLIGWYWLYCVLVVVAYRASMTAILANPAPKVTIDTMKELAENSIACGGWGDQTKEFFLKSLDETGQKIGDKFETVSDSDNGVYRVAKGELAYYDNIYFLTFLSAKQNAKIDTDPKTNTKTDNDSSISNSAEKNSETRKLHIMKECAIHMPISIGLQKNSPLKPKADKLLRKIIEAGLIEKWLNDVMVPIYSLHPPEKETIKALMNLQKLYGGFVALGVGYLISFLFLIGELIHWHCVVKKDPDFDKYAMDVYYKNKKNKKKNSSTSLNIKKIKTYFKK